MFSYILDQYIIAFSAVLYLTLELIFVGRGWHGGLGRLKKLKELKNGKNEVQRWKSLPEKKQRSEMELGQKRYRQLTSSVVYRVPGGNRARGVVEHIAPWQQSSAPEFSFDHSISYTTDQIHHTTGQIQHKMGRIQYTTGQIQ